MSLQPPLRDQPLETYRYERKFLVDMIDEHQIKALIRLHPAMFVMPYPPRWVNNIYFDTAQLDNYLDNINGAVDRGKVRLRWYHGLFDEAANTTLELKIKRGWVGRKIQYPLGRFKLGDDFSNTSIQMYFENGNLPKDVISLIRTQHAVLLNRYKRWYFATHDGRFRITIDAEMVFYHLDQNRNAFRYRYDADHIRIVELKYQKIDDPSAGKVASFFPFPVYKNSKYVMGLESVYW